MNSLEQLLEQKRQRRYELVRSTPTPEPPGYLEDMWDATVEWAGEAKDNIIALAKSNTALRINEVNSMMMEGRDELDKNVPVMTPEQLEMWNKHIELSDAFINNTLRPAALGVSALATIPALFAAAGAAVPMAVAFKIGALAYTPFMLADLAKSVEDNGVGETALEVVKGINPKYGYDQLVDAPGWDEYEAQHPGRALYQKTTTVLDGLGTFAHPLGKGLGKAGRFTKKVGASAYAKAKDPLIHLTSQPLIAEQLHFMEQKLHLDKMQDVVKKVKEGKLRFPPKPKQEQIVENIAKDIEIKKNKPVETQYYKKGGIDIPVGESNIAMPIKARAIYNTAKRIVNINFGSFKNGVPRNVLGYFEVKSKGIRVKGHLDFETASHEIGHFLDDVMQIKGADSELIKRYKGTFKDTDYTPDKHRSEGIAEFTKDYMYNPEEAQKSCPEFYKAFTEELAKHPQLAKDMELLGNQIRKWETMSDTERLGGIIDHGTDVPEHTLYENLNKYYLKGKSLIIDDKTVLKDFVEQTENRIGTKVLESENPYLIAKAVESNSNARIELFTRKRASKGYIDALNEAFGEEVFTKEAFLMDAFAEIPDDFDVKHADWLKMSQSKDGYEGFGAYMVASSGLERAKEVGRRQMQELPKQLEIVLEKLKSLKNDPTAIVEYSEWELVAVQLLEKIEYIGRTGYSPDYDMPFTIEAAKKIKDTAPEEILNAASKLRDFNENVLNLAEHYGMIDESQKQFLLTVYQHYVPFQRVFDGDLEGLTSDYKAPVGKATDIKTFIVPMSEDGSTRLIKEPFNEYMKQVESLIRKGEQNQVGLAFVKLYENVEGMSDLLTKDHHKAAVNDKNMTFAVWNKGVRQVYKASDRLFYEALKNTDVRHLNALEKIAKLVASAFRETVTGIPSFALMNAFRDSPTAFLNSKSSKVIPLVPIVDTVQGAFAKYSDKDLWDKFQVMGVAHSTLTNENFRSIVTKQKVKIATPADLLLWGKTQVGRAMNLSHGFNEAVEVAPRFQEFKRVYLETGDIHKAARAAKEITTDFTQGGSLVRYWNQFVPFLNASIQGGRTLWNNTIGAKENRGVKIMRATLLISAGIGLYQYNKDDKRYRELPMDFKNRFYCFFPFEDSDYVITIPKDQGLGVFTSVIERVLDWHQANNLEAPDEIAPLLINNFTPTPIPRIIYPMFELVTNYNLFTGQDIVPKHMQDASPKYQYDEKTSYLARGIGDFFNWSPKMIDHTIAGYLGTVGKEMLRASDFIYTLGDTNRPDKGLADVPIVGRIVRDPSFNSEPVRIFYKKYKEAKREVEDEKIRTGAAKAKKTDTLKAFEKHSKKLNELWKKKRNISGNRKYTPAQQQREIKKLSKEATRMSSEFLKQHTDYQY